MERRNFMKAAGGIAGTSMVGGAALLASTGAASASAGGSISDPSTAVSDDGEIKWVNTKTDGRVTWDGFDEPVGFIRILVNVELKRNGNTLWQGRIHDTDLVDTSQGSGWGGPGEAIVLNGDYGEGRAGYVASDADWDIIQSSSYDDGSNFPQDPAPADPLYSTADGETTDTRVILGSRYLLYDNNQNELTGTSGYPDRPAFSSDFVVSVENQSATTGSGGADAEDEDDDSADVGV